MRRLITACNEFEWVARTKPLSRKGCDMLADVVHESLENYRVLLPPFSYVSLSLSPYLFLSTSTPWQPTSNPTPRSASAHLLSVRATVSIHGQIISAITKPSEREGGDRKGIPSRIHRTDPCSPPSFLQTVFFFFLLSRGGGGSSRRILEKAEGRVSC